MPAITASSSPRSSARPPSSCARAPRACAISAPACRRPTRSSCCRASRRWRAHGAPHGEHARGARIPHRRTRRSTGCCIPRWKIIPTMQLAQDGCCRAARARSSASASRAAARPARNSSRRCGWSAISPMSATPRRWSSIPPAPRISRWTPRSCKAAGIGEELVRLSVGIEAAADIIDDLGQALRASQKV